MKSSLQHIQKQGEFPVSAYIYTTHIHSITLINAQPSFDSKEDQNSLGQCPVSDAFIQSQKDRINAYLSSHPNPLTKTKLFILDGFLLYTPSLTAIQPYLDLKLFLRVSHHAAKTRREARSGYVTLEGFWEDPPGYVDKIVWPNYVEEHAFLFEDGDVEGKVKGDVVEEWGIVTQEGGVDLEMERTLEWAVGIVLAELERISRIQDSLSS